MAKIHFASLSAVAVLTLVSFPRLAPAEEKAPIVIITSDRASLLYTVGTSVAQAISPAVPRRLDVKPMPGTSQIFPALEKGTADFTPISSLEATLAFHGPEQLKISGKNPYERYKSLRLVTRGFPIVSALVVRRDSPIKSIAEVRGHKTTGDYSEHQSLWFNMYGTLATAGLGFDDVKVVPVKTANDGLISLLKGESEVTIYAVGSPRLKEADAKIGIRHLSADCSPEGVKRMKAAVPAYYPLTMKKGEATGIVEDTCVAAYDLYWLSHAGESDEVVTSVLKAIWDNVEKVQKAHPTLKDWTRERAASADVTVPYHPAAVKFFKEKGVWTDKMEENQKKLLSQAN